MIAMIYEELFLRFFVEGREYQLNDLSLFLLKLLRMEKLLMKGDNEINVRIYSTEAQQEARIVPSYLQHILEKHD
jgi:hypothetical protein